MHLQLFTPGTLASLVRSSLANSFVGGIHPHKERLHACCAAVLDQSERTFVEGPLIAPKEDTTRNALVWSWPDAISLQLR